MLLPRLTALLFAVNVAHAFKNTSPFFLLSSQPLPSDAPLQSAQIALTKDVEDRLIETLSSCEAKWYYIWSQEHVAGDDFREGAMPKLQKRVASARDGSVVQIPEVMVMGELSSRSIKKRLEEACSAKGKKSVDAWPTAEDEYFIAVTNRPALPQKAHERSAALSDTDNTIDEILNLENHPSVFIYITTPPSPQPQDSEDSHLYEMDDPYPSALHIDLKRDLHQSQKRQDDDGLNMQAGLGLFEKYQFFTPGLFMGLGVSIFLAMILYIGIGAIAGLEVSYMAFSKEMGPQAQKKQQ